MENLLDKEIEELKDESKEYQIGFAQGCYEKDLDWKDKIKARIKEVQQRKENDGECELALHGFQREAKIEVLQSLLEKE